MHELRKLGVQAIEFSGGKTIGSLRVLGKGCVGIVVIAYAKAGKAALKIRRTDANREEMEHEAEMLKKANSFNVGPRLFGFTSNFLMMEFIEGKLLPVWLDALNNERKHVQARLIKVLRDLLEQCWRLDKAGLDHGELSHAPKHIVVTATDVPYILDFETASLNRRPSNLTSLCHYMFISNQIAVKIAEKFRRVNRERLINALRVYKRNFSEKNFRNVLDVCGLKV